MASETPTPLCGLLNVNKPAGRTSRDAVNAVQRLLRQRARAANAKPEKVGHAGTLDPIATGVLVLCVGAATKLTEHVQRQPKRYRGTFLLGRRSPSDDIELPAEMLVDPPQPTRADVEAAAARFVGAIEQVPPAFSAIKIAGRKAYDLARAGETVDVPPRRVEIYDLRVDRYEYPELVLDVRCGGGTYIRALGRDLAEGLGTGAVMSGLQRTEIGAFTLRDAVDAESLDAESLGEALLPAGAAVAELPRVEVTEEAVTELQHGRFLAGCNPPPGDELAAFGPGGELVALLKPRSDGRLQPTRTFAR